MPGALICPRCGANLPGEGWEGLCPMCLVRVSLADRKEGGVQSIDSKTLAPAATPPSDQAMGFKEKPLRGFGDYELIEEIGRGGMGVVFRAKQVSLNRLVAVKMIVSGELASPEFVQRFRLEAEAAASLQHPNIVAIHEVGMYEGQHFYSMDYVEGQTLAEQVLNKPLPPQLAADYLKTIAEAVHYAHQRGILHRDLKPSNVLIDSLDQPHLTDFGLAKRLTSDSELTLTGQVLGSPNYMPPEQALGQRQAATIACDVYSLGAILYFLLTARPPFAAESMTQTLQQLLHSEPVSPQILNPAVPRDLETICLKCLSKEPPRRYGSAQELAADLGRFLKGEPVQARPVGPSARAWRWCRRNPKLTSLAGISAVLLLAVAIGSPLTVLRINRERKRAEQNEKKATEKLWDSYMAQARANRWSGRAGRRFDSLEVLMKAAEIRPSLELRNEAIACMALTDTRSTRNLLLNGPRDVYYCFAPRLDLYVELNDERMTVSVHRVPDGLELMRIPAPLAGPRTALGFSPDSRCLALVATPDGSSIARLTVWDLNTGKVIFQKSGDFGVQGIDFSPDSKLIAVAFCRGESQLSPPVQVFDFVSGEHILSLDQTLDPKEMRFDPRRGRLALCSQASSNLEVYDLKSRKLMHSLKHLATVTRFVWRPDGDLLAAACTDKRVYVWEVSSGKLRNVLFGPQSDIIQLAFNHAGDLLAASGWDHMIRLWDPLGATSALSMPGVLVGFSPDDRRLAFIPSDGKVVFADVVRGLECRLLHSFEPGKGPGGCHFSRQGQWLASAHSDGVRFWDTVAGKEVAFLPLPNSSSAVFHPDGKSLFVSGAGGISQWFFDCRSNGQTCEIQIGLLRKFTRSSSYGRVSLDRGGCILAFIDDECVHVWDLVSKKELRSLAATAPNYIAVSPNAQWCAVGSHQWGRRTQICDVKTGQIVHELPETASTTVTLSPDGNWLGTCGMDECRFWAVGSWECVHKLPRESEGIQVPIAFTPDSHIAAVAWAPTKVRLLALPSFCELATLESPDPQYLSSLCFSPDGSQLAAGTETKHIQLWDLRSIRQQLEAMGLDWDAPPLPPPTGTNQALAKIAVTVLKASDESQLLPAR